MPKIRKRTIEISPLVHLIPQLIYPRVYVFPVSMIQLCRDSGPKVAAAIISPIWMDGR